MKFNWEHISEGVPEVSTGLEQYLTFSNGLYTVCTVEYDRFNNRRYFRNDEYIEESPDLYALLPEVPDVTSILDEIDSKIPQTGPIRERFEVAKKTIKAAFVASDLIKNADFDGLLSLVNEFKSHNFPSGGTSQKDALTPPS